MTRFLAFIVLANLVACASRYVPTPGERAQLRQRPNCPTVPSGFSGPCNVHRLEAENTNLREKLAKTKVRNLNES